MCFSARLEALAQLVLLGLVVSGCPEDKSSPAEALIGDGFAGVVAVDDGTVILSLTRAIEPQSVQSQGFWIADYSVAPSESLTVHAVSLSGDAEVTLRTSPQDLDRLYTLHVQGLQDLNGRAIEGSLNFLGAGLRGRAPVQLIVEDVDTASRYGDLRAVISVDNDGRFDGASARLLPLTAGADRWQAELRVEVDPRRTVDRGDDGDLQVDRRAYVARLIDAAGGPASPLVPFAVLSDQPQQVLIPLLAPLERCPDAPVASFELPPPAPDDRPGDGLAHVRVYIDDRQSRELVDASLMVSADEAGVFDADLRQVSLTDQGGGLYVADLHLQVAPERSNLDINNAPTHELPYLLFLTSGGQIYNELLLPVVVVDEGAQVRALPLGEPTRVPVTLRVDIGSAFLSADGSQRGRYPNEAIYLTANLIGVVDALRRNCADSWSGGENLNLRMHERSDQPGVWEKTLWLAPGRSQTFKVLRCLAADGCSALNARVSSTGNAFATVAKNLTTENRDASDNAEVRVVDPGFLDAVSLAGQIHDYSQATVYPGDGSGREPDPPGTPDDAMLFKQEMPNLVANLLGNQACPAQTPLYVIGTWRDINLPETPQQIIASRQPGDQPLNLGPFDYDNGMVGAPPPQRELP